MSNNILDIRKWKEVYPFLDTVWDTYNEFDKHVDGDENISFYYAFCYSLMYKLGDNIEDHKNFCVKLVRNLGVYAPKTKFFKPTFARCHILYSWLYNKSNNPKIPDNIISEIFDDYIYHMKNIENGPKCSYALYNNTYEEPMKINILNIFYDNMGIIKETLSGSDGSQKKSCLKFLCKCAKIYKDIYNSYCENVDKKNEKNERTCLKLDQIKNSYNLYFTIQDSLNSIIPSLDNNKDDYSVKCRTYQPDTELTSEGRTNSDTPPRMRTPGSAEGSDGNLENVLPTSLGNEGNSMKKSITTTIGTVAGASTILTLLYKFTPAGTLLHSGLRGSGRRINNHAYGDDANELSFNGLVHNDFNSYNIGYEAV